MNDTYKNNGDKESNHKLENRVPVSFFLLLHIL